MFTIERVSFQQTQLQHPVCIYAASAVCFYNEIAIISIWKVIMKLADIKTIKTFDTMSSVVSLFGLKIQYCCCKTYIRDFMNLLTFKYTNSADKLCYVLVF